MSIFKLFTLFLLSMLLSSPAYAISWEISCGVDRGSITRQSGAYIFRTSSNHCTGGIFNQRAELNTGDISISRPATYVFDATLSMSSSAANDFVVFQVHDGRDGCSPPLSLRWRGNGKLSFDSDYTRGIGMAGCVENRALRNASYSGPPLKRDGTPYHFQVQLDFDGSGGFEVHVIIDGKSSIAGAYRPSSDPGLVVSKRFYLKHGVYSHHVFDYLMVSSGMKVFKAR